MKTNLDKWNEYQAILKARDDAFIRSVIGPEIPKVFYTMQWRLNTPELFIVGGGVSKHSAEFLPLLDLRTPMVPAKLLNNAGLMGAAVLAAEANGSADTPGSVGA